MKQSSEYRHVCEWLDRQFRHHRSQFAKRLSGNDTLANGSHQAGPYVPKQVLFHAFPELNRPKTENPYVNFELHVDSHQDTRVAKAIWYNNKLRGGTRNETRITNLGGLSSPLLNPESTGAICVFAFDTKTKLAQKSWNVWVCQGEEEERAVEDLLGPLEPGEKIYARQPTLISAATLPTEQVTDAHPSQFPSSWLKEFPKPIEIVQSVIDFQNELDLNPDTRLLRRREREYSLFKSVEREFYQPLVQMQNQTFDSLFSLFQSVAQRRKARSGKSLELHVKAILVEEKLLFEYNAQSEPGRRPDFLFPSSSAYADCEYPSAKLRMLAVKTTAKDRWRQVLNEANRIERKHLLTLQEGISETQFQEMVDSNLQLVVPESNIKKYPSVIRSQLQTFADFISEIRGLGHTYE